MITILFLAANPTDTPRLALDQEVKEIVTRIRKAALGHHFRVEIEWAVRADEIQAALLRHKPQIVHFAGHGQTNAQQTSAREFGSPRRAGANAGILVENLVRAATPIPDEALSEMFRIVGGVACVVLNACHSAHQAQAILRHVQVVVGMEEVIDDTSAMQFAAGFYEALAFGRTVQTAFDLGKNQIALQNLPNANIPALSTQRGIDANTLVLVRETDAATNSAPGKTKGRLSDAPPGTAKKVLWSWIHMSDIHVGHADATYGYDQKLVLDELCQDVPKVCQGSALSPDAILVTGDVAFGGGCRTPTEYVDAKEWLEHLAITMNLQNKHIYLVPGNHDINRGNDRARRVARLIDALRSGKDTPDAALDEALKDEDDRSELAKRMLPFLEFAAHFAPWCHHDALPPAHERLYWRHTVAAGGGLRVRLVGLNTALLAADKTDEGKLQLGMEQLHFALEEAPAADELIVVLTHHPLRPWLFDGKNAEQWIQSRAHVHLFGHVHASDVESVRHGSGKSFVRMLAGAVHGENDKPGTVTRQGYNVAAIEQDEHGALALRIWPRRWSDKHKEFRADMDLLADGQTSLAHPLPMTIERISKTEFSTPRPPDIVPITMVGTMPLGTVGTQWLTGELMPIWSGGKATDSCLHFDLKNQAGQAIELGSSFPAPSARMRFT